MVPVSFPEDVGSWVSQVMASPPRFSCKKIHQAAFPQASGWRKKFGTPVAQILNARYCPLCPGWRVREPRRSDEPLMDEDTLICECCSSRWLMTIDDQLQWDLQGDCIVSTQPLRISGPGPAQITHALNTVFATQHDGRAAIYMADSWVELNGSRRQQRVAAAHDHIHLGPGQADIPEGPRLNLPGPADQPA